MRDEDDGKAAVGMIFEFGLLNTEGEDESASSASILPEPSII
jgi:hypothetical protein